MVPPQPFDAPRVLRGTRSSAKFDPEHAPRSPRGERWWLGLLQHDRPLLRLMLRTSRMTVKESVARRARVFGSVAGGWASTPSSV